MMNFETQAAQVAGKYERVIGLATSRAYGKYRAYLAARGHLAPFAYEDIRQCALEAVLLLAGLLPGRKHALSGKLAETEALGGERFVQRSVDMYVLAWCAHEVERARAAKRAEDPESLDAFAEDKERGAGMPITALETSDVALTGVEARWPLHWAVRVEKRRWYEVAGSLNLGHLEWEERWDQEEKDIVAWALANRRIKA